MPLIGLVSVALAHDAIGSYGLRPFVRDGELVAAWTTWGIVVREDGRWERVCEEAFPGQRDLWLREDGELILASSVGLVRSSDAGCTITSGQITEPVTMLLDAGEKGYAIVDRGVSDGLLVTTDGWWTSSERALPEAIDLRSLAVSGDGTLWLTGLRGGVPAVHSETAEGFLSQPLPDPRAALVIAHGAAPDGQGITLSTVLPDGTGQLWTSRGEGPSELLASLPLAVTGYGCVADRCLVAINQSVLLGWQRSQPAPVQPEIVEGPARCLWVIDGEVWGCSALDAPAHFARTDDGVTFTDELYRSVVLERTCPEGSPGELACSDLQPPPPESDTATVPPITEPSRRCGCRTGAGAGWLAVGLVVCCGPRRWRASTIRWIIDGAGELRLRAGARAL